MLSPSLSGLWLHNPSYNSSVGKGYEEDLYIPKILVGQYSTPSLPLSLLPLFLSVSNLFLFLNCFSSKQRSLDSGKEKAGVTRRNSRLVQARHPKSMSKIFRASFRSEFRKSRRECSRNSRKCTYLYCYKSSLLSPPLSVSN